MKAFSKRPRLKSFDYLGRHRYFITMCTHRKQPLFKHKETVEDCIRLLEEKSKALGLKVWAYCFMPDHLHLLLEGVKADSDLKRFVSAFKQSAGYHYSQSFKHVKGSDDNPQNVAQRFSADGKPRLWQPSFYDHVLRKDEDLLSVADYIYNNPVRKGLVDRLEAYPFLGSLEK